METTIELYQFVPAWELPNSSPFCLKLETYLRMVKLPFKTVVTNDLRQAPKGKMPYIRDRGKIIADSNLILEYLQQTYGCNLDDHLNASELAISLAMKRLLEENLYWVLTYSRWQEPKNWAITKAAFFDDFPPILRQIIPPLARKTTLQNLHGQGIGRHSASEVYQIGTLDAIALSNFLAEKPFFMGDRPTTLDATAYGILANILWVPIESPLKQKVQTLTNLVDYCQRMKAQFYPA
ncbi:glutathione S-transferase family protein [Lusitaniella coriacea LEGE 07157]|uniref:Glutathione S-transferase family protein n=1 Tax=Lusitaniella coriacea LEGE 07157 TaxID=945747 RepID=A0A8J7E080_9CYAN|nr:glutathione S-transferase family protein [Lusitaniella coriacea]MBE9118673.1 glutathione S-transferase family protein [Lusitaniella coriacea LEGE 07157]